MDAAKRGNKQIGGTGNVVVEKFGKIKWQERIGNDEVLTIVKENR